MKIGIFIVRVYGIAIRDDNKVLITDEIYQSKQFTKFPGGGMEMGEGSIDCLKRECFEELGQLAEVGEHIYTTDFYQPSIFIPGSQVLCIYYRINLPFLNQISVKQRKFDFPELKDGTIVFRWAEINEVLPEEFTFENDKRVAKILSDKYGK
jgi:8-oxo-dGTP diphosphatase